MGEKSITLVYRELQKREARAVTENHRISMRGPVEKLSDLFEEKSNIDLIQEVRKIAEPALTKYLNGLTPLQVQKRRHERIQKALGNLEERVEDIPLSQIDRYAESWIQKSGWIVSLTGMIGGIGGVAVGLAELPHLMNRGFETMEEICEAYGFDASDYFEKLYILMILLFCLVPDGESRGPVYAKMHLIEGWIHQGGVSLSDKNFYYPPAEAAAFCSEYLASALVTNRLCQAVPVVGPVLGASMNFGFVSRLGNNALTFYKRRYIEKKLGLPE